jgi:hypothetical protein
MSFPRPQKRRKRKGTGDYLGETSYPMPTRWETPNDLVSVVIEANAHQPVTGPDCDQGNAPEACGAAESSRKALFDVRSKEEVGPRPRVGPCG